MKFSDVAGPDELDHNLNREEPEEGDARKRQPNPDASEARAGEELTQPPERERGESGRAETDVHTVRDVVAEHELAALAREK